MAFPKDVFILSLGMLREATEVVCTFSPILIIERMSISMHAEAITDHFAYVIYTSCQYVLNYSRQSRTDMAHTLHNYHLRAG